MEGLSVGLPVVAVVVCFFGLGDGDIDRGVTILETCAKLSCGVHDGSGGLGDVAEHTIGSDQELDEVARFHLSDPLDLENIEEVEEGGVVEFSIRGEILRDVGHRDDLIVSCLGINVALSVSGRWITLHLTHLSFVEEGDILSNCFSESFELRV